MYEQRTLATHIENYNFGDKRLNHRLVRLYHQLGFDIESGVSEVISNPCQLKGFYRFINNKKVTTESLVTVFQQYSKELVCEESVILALQDTTELDYTSHRSAAHLGCMEYRHKKGLYLHNHILVSDLGLPLGIFSQRFWSREVENLGKSKTRKYLPIEQKESYRWLAEFDALQEAFASQTEKQIIQICDRESDISELLTARKYDHIHYIIRSKNARIDVETGLKLPEVLAENMPCFQYKQQVFNSEGEVREALLSLRYQKVKLNVPYRQGKKLPQPTVWVVEAKEDQPPENEKGLCWRLLCSMPIENPQMAQKVIRYYTLRWLIERFHHILKQGKKVEKLQIVKPQALQNAIVLQGWIALKVMTLAYLPRTNPELKLEQTGFKKEDYELVYRFLTQTKRNKIRYDPEPTINQFAKLIALLGGSPLQKNRPLGTVSLWRGLKTFTIIKATSQIIKDVGKR